MAATQNHQSNETEEREKGKQSTKEDGERGGKKKRGGRANIPMNNTREGREMKKKNREAAGRRKREKKAIRK